MNKIIQIYKDALKKHYLIVVAYVIVIAAIGCSYYWLDADEYQTEFTTFVESYDLEFSVKCPLGTEL